MSGLAFAGAAAVALATMGPVFSGTLPAAPAGLPTQAAAPTSQASALPEPAPPPWQHAVPASAKAQALKAVDDEPAGTSVRVTTVASRHGTPVFTTRLLSHDAARAVLAAAVRDPSVVTAAIDTPVRIAATGTDPLRSQQWALTALQAETALSRHDATGVTVAVVDTGVQATHPDLAAIVLKGTDLVTPGGGDGSADGNGHGTHVAGIIDSVGGNGIGTMGLAQGAKILPVKALDDKGSGWTSTIARGIAYATDRGAQVINLSVGGKDPDAALQAAVAYAIGKGVVVVAAAGNERQSGNPVEYPAAYPNVLAVAATDSSGSSASFSETGSYVTLAAPGVSILSTYNASRYATASGTSMATPYVVAAAALLKAAKPSLTPSQVSAALTSTATDRGAPGRDNEFGAGIINPVAALCSVGFCGTTPTPSAGPTGSPTSGPPTASPSPTPSGSSSQSPVASSTASPTTTAPATIPSTITVTSPPGNVVYGGTVPVTATLTAGGSPVPASPVQVCTRVQATGATSCTVVTTSGTGQISTSVPMAGKGTVRLSYGGTATIAPTTTAELPVAVLSAVTLAGGNGTLIATIRPAAGQGWRLQRLVGSTWTLTSSGTLPSAPSAAGVKLTLSGLPTGTYRVTVLATALLSETASSTVAVAKRR